VRGGLDLEVAMKTSGEIEAAVCQAISKFEQDFMGRGPKDIRAHLIDDMMVVRLQGVLTAAEQHLVKTLPSEKGRDLLKQVRTHLIETARPTMEAMIQSVVDAKVVNLLGDACSLPIAQNWRQAETAATLIIGLILPNHRPRVKGSVGNYDPCAMDNFRASRD